MERNKVKSERKKGKSVVLLITFILFATILASHNAEAVRIGKCLSDIPTVFIKKFKENIDGVFSPITNLFKKEEQRTTGFFGKISGWIKEKFSDLSSLKETAEKIKDFFTNTLGTPFAIIYEMVTNLLNNPGVATFLVALLQMVILGYSFRKLGAPVLIMIWLFIFAAYFATGANKDFLFAAVYSMTIFSVFLLAGIGIGAIVEKIRGRPSGESSFKRIKEMGSKIWGILKDLPWGKILKALFAITGFMLGLTALIATIQTGAETFSCLGKAITDWADAQQSKIIAYFDTFFEKMLFKPIDAIIGTVERKIDEALAGLGLGGGGRSNTQQRQTQPTQSSQTQTGSNTQNSMREIAEQTICGRTFSKLSSCAQKADAMEQVTLIDQIRGGCGGDDQNKLMSRRNEITSSFGACP